MPPKSHVVIAKKIHAIGRDGASDEYVPTHEVILTAQSGLVKL